MQGQPAESLSPKAQRRLAITAAATIAALALLLGLWIALRTPQYEAAARLAYSPAGLPAGVASEPPVQASSPELPSGPNAAVTVATRALTDADLRALIERYDLYPKLRQKMSGDQLVGRLRQELSFSEPEPDVLQVTVRDPEQDKTQALTNGVAALLSAYEVTTMVPGPPVAPVKTHGKVKPKPKVVAPARPVVPVSAAPGPDLGALSHEIARVNDTLQDLSSARAELLQQQTQVTNKIAAEEQQERRASAADARVGAQDGSHERTVLDQELTAERARLADLRGRYTEQYPDVQRAEANIADLQARLARLPAANALPSTPSGPPSPAMQKLRQEQERVQGDLARNSATRASEEARKADLEARIEQARLMPRGASGQADAGASGIGIESAGPPAAGQAGTGQRAPAAEAAAASSDALASTVPAVVLPFRMVERAGSAGLVGRSRFALVMWLVIGTLVLLTLCFVPLVPAHYSAVVTTPEELKENVPEHVTYLGDVGSSKP